VPVTLVQKAGAQSAGNTTGLVVTLGSPPTAGNLLVAACNSDATVATPAGFTLAVSAVSGQGLYIFYRVVQSGDGSSVTFAPNVADSCAGGVLEYSGLTATPLDQTASNTTGSSASSLATGTTGTTSQADELIIVVVGPHAGNNHPWVLQSWSAGYTSQIEEPNGLATVGSASSACHIGDRIVSATGTYSATGTWAPASSDAGAAIATFKITPGGANLSLAADGLASSSGTASVNLTEPLAATGLASSSGTAAIRGVSGLAAGGLASSSGTATINRLIPLVAQGLAASFGQASFPTTGPPYIPGPTSARRIA
jgi:hypothetical protein